jgi:hypothetical protein
MSADYTLPFFVLIGDADRNRTVNALDFNVLATNYGMSGQLTLQQGDFNFDGIVDSLDFTALAVDFNQTLPSPAPAAGNLFGASPVNLAEDVLA